MNDVSKKCKEIFCVTLYISLLVVYLQKYGQREKTGSFPEAVINEHCIQKD
jgi:hypothetical protein